MKAKTLGRVGVVLVLALGLTGCATNERVDRRIWAKLSASQLFFFQEDQNSLQLHFSITNNSGDLIDPPIESSYLVINGVKWPESETLIGRGSRNQLWERLPGHCCVFFSRTLSSGLFGTPGRHTIVWKGDGFEASPVRITVRTHPQP